MSKRTPKGYGIFSLTRKARKVRSSIEKHEKLFLLNICSFSDAVGAFYARSPSDHQRCGGLYIPPKIKCLARVRMCFPSRFLGALWAQIHSKTSGRLDSVTIISLNYNAFRRFATNRNIRNMKKPCPFMSDAAERPSRLSRISSLQADQVGLRAGGVVRSVGRGHAIGFGFSSQFLPPANCPDTVS